MWITVVHNNKWVDLLNVCRKKVYPQYQILFLSHPTSSNLLSSFLSCHSNRCVEDHIHSLWDQNHHRLNIVSTTTNVVASSSNLCCLFPFSISNWFVLIHCMFSILWCCVFFCFPRTRRRALWLPARASVAIVNITWTHVKRGGSMAALQLRLKAWSCTFLLASSRPYRLVVMV